jgi:DNA polymerase III subunit beta
MKFSIHKSALLQIIQTASKAVAVRTTKQVLTGILLQVEENCLVATAYDLELGIQDKMIANEENGLVIHSPGAIVMPARYFSDVIKKLPSSDVLIQVSNNYMTEVKSGQAEFHLHGIDAAEFPKLPVFQGVQSIQVPSDLLKELIRSTAFAASSSEVRPILTGIYVHCATNKLTFTATDGLRLATRNIPLEESSDGDWTCIIPGKSLLELAKILPDDNRPIQMQLTQSHSLFIVDSTYFYTRLIEGAYPDTTRIIPTASKTEILVDAYALSDAIDRAALIARDKDNHMVRLELTNEQLNVSSSSPEIGNVSESLEAVEKSGEDLIIAFNPRYVLDALKAMPMGEVTIRFNGGNQSFTLRQQNGDNGLQLISPLLWR